MGKQFNKAKADLTERIARSKTLEDPTHAENTMLWVSKLRPDADDILLLAGFGHDVERSRQDRYTREMFDTYDEYKHEHAKKAGEIAWSIAIAAGYSPAEGERLAHIIAEGEFPSDEPDVQLLCDADSISFFDNNAAYYFADKGAEWTKRKMEFAYMRASNRAKGYIERVLVEKPELDLLGLGKHG